MNLHRLLFCALLAVGTGTSGHAGAFCTSIEALIERTTQQSGSGASLALPDQPDVLSNCRSYQAQGGAVALSCGWPFAYRAGAAWDAFDLLIARLGRCNGVVTIPTDQTVVNHPDSYDQQMFHLSGTTLSVTLKDKGALAQTYVFLRMEMPR